MSDFCRMLSIYKFGGIWADIGDTLFPKNFAIVWEKYGLDNMPGAGFRVSMNHSGIVRNPSQHLFAARIRAPIILAFIQRMRKLWKTRMCNIDIEDPKFDAISSTLAWTGMGGTTGPIMRSTPCDVDGKRTNVMDAWKMGFADVRMGKPIKGTKFCLIGRKEKDLNQESLKWMPPQLSSLLKIFMFYFLPYQRKCHEKFTIAAAFTLKAISLRWRNLCAQCPIQKMLLVFFSWSLVVLSCQFHFLTISKLFINF